MKAAIAWFTENHVASNLLMLLMLIGGVAVAFFIKLEVFFPKHLQIESVSLLCIRSISAEVEEGVVRRIEEKLPV